MSHRSLAARELLQPAITQRHLEAEVLDCVGTVQLDVFGLVEVELTRRAEQALWRAEFDARTTRTPDGRPVVWTARHAFPGVRVGEQVPGRRCWLCGAVVANAFVLASQHGLSVDDPFCRDWKSCTAQPVTVPAHRVGGEPA